LRSDSGQGACFVFTLPWKTRPETAGASAPLAFAGESK
jgi:hypothetical protein